MNRTNRKIIGFLKSLGRRTGTDIIPPAQLRLLVALLGECQRHPSRGATFRDLMQRVDGKSTNSIRFSLEALTKKGLITKENFTAASILPHYRLTIFLEALPAPATVP